MEQSTEGTPQVINSHTLLVPYMKGATAGFADAWQATCLKLPSYSKSKEHESNYSVTIEVSSSKSSDDTTHPLMIDTQTNW